MGRPPSEPLCALILGHAHPPPTHTLTLSKGAGGERRRAKMASISPWGGSSSLCSGASMVRWRLSRLGGVLVGHNCHGVWWWVGRGGPRRDRRMAKAYTIGSAMHWIGHHILFSSLLHLSAFEWGSDIEGGLRVGADCVLTHALEWARRDRHAPQNLAVDSPHRPCRPCLSLTKKALNCGLY